MNRQNIFRALNAGLNHLSDPEVRPRADQIDDLAELKGILRAVINGQLIIATPDRLIPEGAEKPTGDNSEET